MSETPNPSVLESPPPAAATATTATTAAPAAPAAAGAAAPAGAKAPRSRAKPKAASTAGAVGGDGESDLVECRVLNLPGRAQGETVWQRPADADEGAARGYWEIVPARSGED